MSIFQNQQKVLLATANVSYNAAAMPTANTFTPLSLTVLSDPNGLIANPTTVDPVLNPQFILPLEYRGGIVTIQATQTARGATAPTMLKTGMYTAGFGSWRIFEVQSTAATPIVVNSELYRTYSIPLSTTFFPAGALPSFTLGVDLSFGAAVTIPMTVNIVLQPLPYLG